MTSGETPTAPDATADKSALSTPAKASGKYVNLKSLVYIHVLGNSKQTCILIVFKDRSVGKSINCIANMQ